MAIYSLHHQPIGKSTQARPHTSAAHVRYITRPSAASHIEAARMPAKPREAAAFMVGAENGDRKNARVSDKLTLALPRELDGQQRAELVRGYAEDITQGRAPWLAAFHDQGKDAHNPHAHLLVRDRDPATGKRVAGLSEMGSTERLRTLWEDHANRALERAGRQERIDRRTLQAQGIERAPTVHEGPKSQQMERRGARPESRLRGYRNRPGSRLPYRQVDYRGIDRGRSRPGYNRDIKEAPADYWQALDADNQARELEQLRAIHHRPDSVQVFGRDILRGQKVPERLNVPSRIPGQSGEAAGVDFIGTGKPIALPFAFDAPVNGVEKRPHTTEYPSSTKGSKQNMVRDDFDGRLQREFDQNEEAMERLNGRFNHHLGQAYQDPKAASKSMDAFRDQHGEEALGHALRNEPGLFGSLPTDPARHDQAHQARREMPNDFFGYKTHRDSNDALRQTMDDRKGRGNGPDNGKQHQPTQLKPSSYPLESPFRAEERPQPAPNAQPAQQWRKPENSTPTPQPAMQPTSFMSKLQDFRNSPQQSGRSQPEGRPPQGRPEPARKPRGGRLDDD